MKKQHDWDRIGITIWVVVTIASPAIAALLDYLRK